MPGFAQLLGKTRKAKKQVDELAVAQQSSDKAADSGDLAHAVQSVRELEAALEQMIRPQAQLQQNLEIEKREHQRTIAKLRQVLDKKDKTISPLESQTMQDALSLMQLYEKQVQAMQAMLQDVPDALCDEARHLKEQLATQESSRQLGAAKLEMLIKHGAGAEEEQFDSKAMQELRTTINSLEQAGATAREIEQKVERVHAEAKHARMHRLQEAKRVLDRMRCEIAAAQPEASLTIPVAPVAAPEDEFSIAVDWVAPEHNVASHYHLQWREQKLGASRGEQAYSEWTSTPASERIQVMCCTKGGLRSHSAYQFRVRAFSSLAKRWGPWSLPSVPTKPKVGMQDAPSRPELTAIAGLKIEVDWSPPVVGSGSKVTKYEVQWCTCGSRLSWTTDQLAKTTEPEYTSPPLKKGSAVYYTFRVRAMIKAYAGGQWSDWSPPAAPCRPFLIEPPPPPTAWEGSPPDDESAVSLPVGATVSGLGAV